MVQNENTTLVSRSAIEQKIHQVEDKIQKASDTLNRLKRFWFQLDQEEREELYEKLEERDDADDYNDEDEHSGSEPEDDSSSREESDIYFNEDDIHEMKTAQKSNVRKTVVVGNTSTFVPDEQRDESANYTHKWMVYIRGPKEEPVLDWVKKVRIVLHESYHPNDKVEILHPPFQLERRGYGEFPIDIYLFFFDKHFKPIKITHQLVLDKGTSNRTINGPETRVEIDLDETFYQLSKKKYNEQVAKYKKDREGSSEPSLKKQKLSKVRQSSPTKQRERPPKSSSQDSDTFIFNALPCMKFEVSLQRDMSNEEKLIHTLGSKYPLIVKDGIAPYMCAKSSDEFMQWTIGKRKACERFRAQYVQKQLKEKYNLDIPTVNILKFLRKAGISPVVDNDNSFDVLML